MTEQIDDLKKRIETTRQLYYRARADLSEMQRLWSSMDRSYPDTYRNDEYWTVRDQLKGGRRRILDKERSVEKLKKDLAKLEAELKELES